MCTRRVRNIQGSHRLWASPFLQASTESHSGPSLRRTLVASWHRLQLRVQCNRDLLDCSSSLDRGGAPRRLIPPPRWPTRISRQARAGRRASTASSCSPAPLGVSSPPRFQHGFRSLQASRHVSRRDRLEAHAGEIPDAACFFERSSVLDLPSHCYAQLWCAKKAIYIQLWPLARDHQGRKVRKLVG